MRHRGRWKQEEDEYLRQNFGKLSAKEMAKKLKRGEKATYNRCYFLGLSKRGKKGSWKKWTQKEKEFLMENYKKLTNQQLGKQLGRSENSVIGMARRMGLSKRRRKRSAGNGSN